MSGCRQSGTHTEICSNKAEPGVHACVHVVSVSFHRHKNILTEDRFNEALTRDDSWTVQKIISVQTAACSLITPTEGSKGSDANEVVTLT